MKFFVISTLLFAASCLASPYHGAAVSTQYHTQDSLGQYSYGYADPNSQKHETRSANGVTQGAYSYVDGHGLTQSVKYSADPVHGFNAVGTNLPVGPSTVHHPVAVVSHAHSIVPASTYAHAYSAPIAYSSPVHYAAVAPAAWSYASAAPAAWSHHGIAAPIAINPHGVPHDTPEVAAAKIAHFAAHAEANANHHHLHKRSLWGGHAYAAPWAHAAAPVIHNGVPVETPEVQHAKAAHFAAHAAASHGHYAGAPAAGHHYAAAVAAPAIHNGHPVDTPEVQHAKAAHFAAVAEAQSRNGAAGHYDNGHYDNGHYDNGDYNNGHYDNGHDSGAYIPSLYESAGQYGGESGHYAGDVGHYAGAVGHYAGGHGHGAIHIPVIKNGVPVETPEVQHAKAAHFAAVAEAQSRSAGHHDSGAWNHYDGHGHHQW